MRSIRDLIPVLKFLIKESDRKVTQCVSGTFGMIFMGLFLLIEGVIARDARCADGSKNSDHILYYPFFLIACLFCVSVAILFWKFANRIVRVTFDYKSLDAEKFVQKMHLYDDAGLIKLYRELIHSHSTSAAMIEKELDARMLVDNKIRNGDKTAVIADDAVTTFRALDASKKVSLTSRFLFVDACNSMQSDLVIKLTDIKRIQARKLLYFPSKIGFLRGKALRIFFKNGSRLKKIDIFPGNPVNWNRILRDTGFHVEEIN